MKVKIEASWAEKLSGEFEKEYFRSLVDTVKAEYAHNTVYPPGREIFNAFDYCSFHQVKVVILGQDPYHGPGQAHGLAFSVPDGVPFPPSLGNIFKELQEELGILPPKTGNLERWAGSIVIERYFDGSCPPARISSKQRLGGFYRCGDRCVEPEA